MEKAGLSRLGMLAVKGFVSPTSQKILRSAPVRAVGRALWRGAGSAANQVIKHPKFYGPIHRNAGKIVGTGAATAATGAATSPLWAPSLADSFKRLLQQFRGDTPEVKSACTLQVHLMTPAMLEKKAWLGAAYNTAKAVGPKLLNKIPGWTAGANAAKARGAAGHFTNAARKMPAGSPAHAQTTAAASQMKGFGSAPGGFFGNLRYGMGRMNPGNSFRLNSGGLASTAYRGALPVATGLTGLGLGYRDGAERGAADTLSEFENMPWYKLMAFGLPNTFGHRQWGIEKGLQKKYDDSNPLMKLFGPDMGDIRNRMDNNRQRFADERSEKWDQWMGNIKNVFAS